MLFSFSKSTAIAQLSNPITKLIISLGIPTKETKAEIQMDPVTLETKIRRFSI